MRSGDKAWVVLGVGVIAWEIWGDELLSEAADRWPPWVARTVAFTLAAHVSNSITPRYDPVHRLFLILKRDASA